MQGRKNKIKILSPFVFIIFLLFSLSGCAYYVKKAPVPLKSGNVIYKSRNEVLKGLAKNYGHFKGMSGRFTMTATGKGFSFEESGLYKYIKGKYVKFIILNIYGNILFYVKLFQGDDRVVFLNPKSKKLKILNLNKKYRGKILFYERLFGVLEIFLNLDSLDKIRKADVFYNTYGGFFFEYHSRDNNEKDNTYYIYVSKNYLINRITIARHEKMIETVYFKNYILKDGSMVPLKIYVDDYLYNVKIKVGISKGSVIIR